jgi:predicted nucleic acid-binding protein
MIVPDINLLVFAYNDMSPEHDAALRWWENLVNGTENIGVPWLVATGFIRLMSNPSVLASSLPGSEAADLVGG